MNREIMRMISQFSYTDVTNNMKLLAAVTPPSIYQYQTYWKITHLQPVVHAFMINKQKGI